MAEVRLHDRHVHGKFQVSVINVGRNGLIFALAAFVLAIVNQSVRVVAQRVRFAQPVDQRLLNTVHDDENQERNAVRVVLAEAKPLGNLGAEVNPPRVVFE